MRRSLIVVVALALAAVAAMLLFFALMDTSETQYRDLSWSPDGKKFAFVEDEYSEGFATRATIWVQDVASGKKVRLTDSGGSPSWSPDSGQIAFGSLGGISVMDADGSHVRRLFPEREFHSISSAVDPSWSPDGRLIAFVSETHDGGVGVFTMGPNGTGVHQVTTGDDSEPDWSPNSARLVFTHRDGEMTSGVIVNADGTGWAPIPGRTSLGDFAYAWSPAGDDIAYGSSLIRVDGTHQRQLPAPWYAFGDGPVWSPDGRKLAFLRVPKAGSRPDGVIQVIDRPTVSRTPLAYHYALAAEGNSVIGDSTIALGYDTDLYLSSPDLPSGSQVLPEYELCVALKHRKRCQFGPVKTVNPEERTLIGGWHFLPDENVDGFLHLSVRIKGRTVATLKLKVVDAPTSP